VSTYTIGAYHNLMNVRENRKVNQESAIQR